MLLVFAGGVFFHAVFTTHCHAKWPFRPWHEVEFGEFTRKRQWTLANWLAKIGLVQHADKLQEFKTVGDFLTAFVSKDSTDKVNKNNLRAFLDAKGIPPDDITKILVSVVDSFQTLFPKWFKSF